MMSEVRTCWEMVEDCPEFVGEIAHLWSWSLNYVGGDARSPFPLFLDLVGFSVEEYGCRVSRWGSGDLDTDGLGWMELDYLGKALIEWADRPRECEEWVRALLAAPEG